MAMEPQPSELTHPEHWRVVERAWYPKGVPSGMRFSLEATLRELTDLGYSADELELAIVNLQTQIAAGFPGIGFNLKCVIRHWGAIQPSPAQILEHRFDKWKAGLPEEWQTYVGMLGQGDMARQCWLGAVGGGLTGGLKDAARKEWARLDDINKHHMELRNGKVVSLRDEMNTVLAKYLPGAED